MALNVEALTVKLGGRAVLRDVSATFEPGRVTVLLGPNGAGKTSLLKAIAALIRPSHGSVRLDGRDVATIVPRERARLIGYLPQDAELHWNLPAREVVALGRTAHRSPFAAASIEDAAAIDRAMRDTATIAFADRPVQELSGGERARVLLARTLAGTPAWLLADEPLASLDPAHQLDMLDRLRAVAGGGQGVVIVLHDLLHAGRVADDVLLLKEGAVLAHGPATEVLTADHLRAAFDITVSVAQGRDGRPVCVTTGRASP